MSPFFIISFILAFTTLGVLCFYYKQRIDNLSVSNGILQRRNDTLEEKFEAADAAQVNAAFKAQDFLLEMGRKHQFDVEELNRDDDWIASGFTYQGGHFVCYTSVEQSELLLYFRGIKALPYTPENYEKVRTVCFRMTERYRHGKVIYQYDNTENPSLLLMPVLVQPIRPKMRLCIFWLYASK